MKINNENSPALDQKLPPESESLKSEDCDGCLIPFDWRYSAAIVGLSRYLDFISKKYYSQKKRYLICDDSIFKFKKLDVYPFKMLFSEENVDKCSKFETNHKSNADIEPLFDPEEEYYLFAQEYFKEDMHHSVVESRLMDSTSLSKEEIDEINKRLSANTIMKKIFKEFKCSEENRSDILKVIDSNRLDIIKNTFQNMKKGYANFVNPNLMQSSKGEICRLVGFNVDMGRKTKGISFGFDDSIFVGRDEFEFDFIPFAFSNSMEAIFINNNDSIQEMIKSNDTLQLSLNQNQSSNDQKKNSINFRNLLFFTNMEGANYINYDVEMILKKRDISYFETMMIRKEAIKIFDEIDNMERAKSQEEKSIVRALNRSCRLSNGEYLPIMEETVNHILNGIYLDDLIECLLKDKYKESVSPHGFLISQLIIINSILYRKKEEVVKEFENAGSEIKSSNKKIAPMKSAKETSKEVVLSLIKSGAENKIRAYRQKLISCLIFKNYSGFIEIMLQLSSYTQVSMPFIYQLAYDFEKNKNIAYVFVNNLENYNAEKEQK